MKTFLDKLNMRPHERRLVVVIALVFFFVINLWFVWPHYYDWRIVLNRTGQAQKKLASYQAEIGRMPANEARLKELESAGTQVASEEQALQLRRTVNTTAIASGVMVSNSGTGTRANESQSKNSFFEEHILRIQFNCDTGELVNFLVSLASSSSMIRVSDLTLSTEAGQTRLRGNATLVASYQKTEKPKPITPARPSPKKNRRT